MNTAALALLLLVGTAHAAGWEDALSGASPEAKLAIRARCTASASERSYGVVNRVSSIYVRADDRYVVPALNFYSELSGISSTNLPYQFLRNGLHAVEVEEGIMDGPGFPTQRSRESRRVILFDTESRDTSLIDEPHAPVEIVYSRATTEAEEAMGIGGRTIRVRLRATNQLLAERTEFFWIVGKVWDKNAICPAFSLSFQTQPSHFVGQVVNPITYPCMRQFAQEKTIAKVDAYRSLPKFSEASKASAAWGEKVVARERQIFNDLTACEAAYFGTYVKREPSVDWSPSRVESPHSR